MVDLRDLKQVEKFVRERLSNQPLRLKHVFVVAEKVLESAERIKSYSPDIEIDPRQAYSAALLHDIGYAKDIAETGFHPLDGYNFLKEQGYPELAELILGHSSSPEAAEVSGFPLIIPSEALAAKLITYWDMHIKQGGEEVSFTERVEDIIARYGSDSAAATTIRRAKPRIECLIKEVQALLENR